MWYVYHYLPAAFWEPKTIDTTEKYEALRAHHPNVLWSSLQLFGHWLYDREIQHPQAYVSLVAQRLRSLAALERHNSQAGQLQQLTFNNLNSYRQQFRPCRAVPPNTDRLSSLTPREQKIFGMWSGTGLRKDSFISIRPELTSLVMPEGKFVKCQVPSVKSIPDPGMPFFVYIPEPMFEPGVFPVDEYECDQIARKLGTTAHGIRRALAIYLRRRAVELGLFPTVDGKPSKQYLNFMKKVNACFAWTENSYMWTEVYAQDAIHYINAKFMIHEYIDEYFVRGN